MTRRHLALIVSAVVVASILVLVGRSESNTDVHATNSRIARIFGLVGGDLDARLNAYRPTPKFGCFLYRFGRSNPYGIEICVDEAGRVVETIDRRNGAEHIASLRYEPSESTVHVDVTRLVAILHHRDPILYPASVRLLPLSSSDLGPIVLPKARKATRQR
jgi:hypothetical protein